MGAITGVIAVAIMVVTMEVDRIGVSRSVTVSAGFPTVRVIPAIQGGAMLRVPIMAIGPRTRLTDQFTDMVAAAGNRPDR